MEVPRVPEVLGEPAASTVLCSPFCCMTTLRGRGEERGRSPLALPSVDFVFLPSFLPCPVSCLRSASPSTSSLFLAGHPAGLLFAPQHN
eukprot:362932-Chlamydomonas_euryale.AAC.6